MLSGLLPNGERLGIARDGKWQHRPGWDLTFSAPKSVSILALVGRDEQVVAAHNKAVEVTLNKIEKDCAQARTFVKGKIEYEDTENLLAGLFLHHVSRELDPDLHTHSAILNVTQRADGKIRSLSSKPGKQSVNKVDGFGERVCDRMKYYGTYYRSQLAYEVCQLGYKIEAREDLHSFEIKGIPKSLIQAMSKRRTQIKKKLDELGRYDSKTNEYATLVTRAEKGEVDKGVVDKTWQEESKSHDFDVKNFKKEYQVSSIDTKRSAASSRQMKEVIYTACQHLAEREAVFTRDNLSTTAMHYGFGNVSPDKIEETIALFVSSKVLIPRTMNVLGRNVDGWTTKEALRIEKSLIETLHVAPRNAYQAAPLEKAQLFVKELPLAQQAAACSLLTSSERFLGVQGFAGVGKTTLLKSIRAFYEQKFWSVKKLGYKPTQICGVAPQGSAANQLYEGAGIPAKTLHSFLAGLKKVSPDPETKLPNQQMLRSNPYYHNLVVVDEASMIANKNMLELMQYANQLDFRVILVGDEVQLGAIEAGKPFSILQRTGMPTIEMKEIVRQSNPILKSAVYHAIDNEIKAAFGKLGDNVIERPDHDKKISDLVTHYFSLSKQERDKTLVLAPSHADRLVLNELLREGLVKREEISKKSQCVEILVQKGLTRAEQKYAINYKIGDQVRFNRNYETLSVKTGDYCKIEEIDEVTNTILLSVGEANSSKFVSWQLSKIAAGVLGAMEVYKVEEREIAKGELVRWTRNNKLQKQTNAEKATVLRVKENEITFKLQDGKKLKLDPKQPSNQHFEYAYANTVHFSQGQTCSTVLALANSYNKRLSSLRAFYVTISRARESAFLYTDNKEALMKLIEINSGEKTSALEAFNEKVKEREEPYKGQVTPQSSKRIEKADVTENSEKFNKAEVKPAHRYDAAQILGQLLDNTEDFTERLLGPPNAKLSNNKELRFGNKGSLVVSLVGGQRGLWHSHEEGRGGNLLQLIQREHSCNFEKALEHAVDFLNLSSTQSIEKKITPSMLKSMTPKEEDKTQVVEDLKKIAYAKSLYEKAKPISGTLAEKYLRVHRGITTTLGDNLRYIPAMKDYSSGQNYPALLAAARNGAGEVQAVQVTYLDSLTANKADLAITKRTLGRMKFGASVTLQQGSEEKNVIMAEGIETGLSLAEAFPDCTVKSTLSIGNFLKSAEADKSTQPLILCVDNDGKSEKMEQTVSKVVAECFDKNRAVVVSMPTTLKTDFNDVQKDKGSDAVQKIVSKDIQSKNKHYCYSESPAVKQASSSQTINQPSSREDKLSTFISEPQANRDTEKLELMDALQNQNKNISVRDLPAKIDKSYLSER